MSDVAMTSQKAPAALRRAPAVVVLVVLLLLPLYLDPEWLKAGQFVMIGAVGAIGLTLLVGQAGQLSLAHGFFLLVGATTYTVFSAPTDDSRVIGFGWDPLISLIAAVAVSALAGILFAPVAGRLRGIYLGIASLSLVFLGLYIGQAAETLTGGTSRGRNPEVFSLFGLPISDGGPHLVVFGVPLQKAERGWYLFLLFTVIAYLMASRAIRGRIGRAWRAVLNNEAVATAMGVNVTRAKAGAFAVSSSYAGLAGVMTVMWLDILQPDENEFGTYGINVSIAVLAMVIIGGLGSVPGAVAGALIVNGVPQFLTLYGADFGWFKGSGEGAITPALIGSFVYGFAVIAVMVFEPGGMAATGHRITAGINRIGRLFPLGKDRNIDGQSKQ